MFKMKHDAKMKSLASASGISAFLGITEPAIFGVNLKLRYPFYGSLIGGGIGAAYATLMGVLSVSQGPCGIIGVICIRPDCMFQFIISMIVATIASFIATTLLGGILGKKEMKKETVPNTSTPIVEVKSNIVDMENVEKVLYAPIQGNIITRENFLSYYFFNINIIYLQ